MATIEELLIRKSKAESIILDVNKKLSNHSLCQESIELLLSAIDDATRSLMITKKQLRNDK